MSAASSPHNTVELSTPPSAALYDVRPPDGGCHAHGFRLLAPAARQPRVDCWYDIEQYGAGFPVDHYLARDPFPLPDTPDREGYHGERHFAYWISGLCDWLEISRAVARHGTALRPGDQVLDLGCASGRTLRHFACQSDVLTVWGADIKSRNVEWCTKFLPRNVRPFFGTHAAHLPIADNSLALTYAFSVFTHIDEFEFAWLAELHRVLKPGGIAYLTVHTERLWTEMPHTRDKHPIWMDILSHQHSPEHPIDPAQFYKPMPQDRVVLAMGPHMGNVNVFHSDRYLQNVWGRLFHIAEMIETTDRVQAEVVLVKR
jgi:SAM-dependent methyltransferase